jgi:4-amino-4-deoxy-L-arabinose transferase-like glycosyltransferase
LLIVYFTLFHLGATDFWGNIAESRRAQISREMLDPGASILVPTLNGEAILTKPPLFYWLQAASYRLTGVVDSASARLPSAIAAMTMLAAIFLVGKRVRDGVTGVLAIGMTAATVLYVNYSRSAEMDMVFSALITVSMAFLFVDMNVESGLEQKRWPIMGFWLFCGLAFMAKGPFALLFPLAAVAAFAGFAKEWRPLRRLLYIPGMVVFVLLIVPYYVYLLHYSDAAAQVIGRETVGRFADGAAHGEPFYYYLEKLMDFMPWLPLLPFALRYAWRKRRRDGLFIICIIGTSFLVASIAPSKKSVYMLPLYPWMALLCADWLVYLSSQSSRLQKDVVGYLKLLTALAFVMDLTMVAIAVWCNVELLPLTAMIIIAGLTIVFIPGLVKHRDAAATGRSAIVVLLLTVCLAYHYFLPTLNDMHSVRKFALATSRVVDENETVFMYRVENYALPFYSHRRFKYLAKDQTPPSAAFVVVRRGDLRYLLDTGGQLGVLLQNCLLVNIESLTDKYDLLLVKTAMF